MFYIKKYKEPNKWDKQVNKHRTSLESPAVIQEAVILNHMQCASVNRSAKKKKKSTILF